MKGKLKKIDNKWYIIRGDFKLPLHSNFITMTDYVWVRGIKVYDGDEVEFTEVFVNPIGREVDPNDLGQNQSKCIWYASPSLDEKEDLGYTTKMGIEVSDEIVRETMIPKEYFGKDEQKRHLIDMMESDEELDLYKETIPELVNIPMMVSMDGKNWKRRNVIALSKGIYVTLNNIKTDADTDEEFRSIDYWKFAKPIKL